MAPAVTAFLAVAASVCAAIARASLFSYSPTCVCNSRANKIQILESPLSNEPYAPDVATAATCIGASSQVPPVPPIERPKAMEIGKTLMRRVESLLRHSGSVRRMLVKTLVRGRGIIDGTGTGYLDGYGLLIEDRRILTAATHEELEGRQDEVLDLGDAILLPGFVDAHTHITVRPGEGDQHGQLRDVGVCIDEPRQQYGDRKSVV